MSWNGSRRKLSLKLIEQFKPPVQTPIDHIKSILELYPDDQTNLSQTCILPEFISNSSKIIDRSDHWSLLLFKEALAIRRFKPELNHGTKASKDFS